MASDTHLPLFIYIILHDISLICSFIISYPLYFTYFIYFFPYIIKIISLLSPYFIITVFLSLIITTTTSLCPNLPQFELGILQSVIQELKLSNLDDLDIDNVEEFEIYQILFDDTLLIMLCDESVEDMKILENDVKVVYVDEERPISIVKTYQMDVDSTLNDPCMDKSCIEKIWDNVGVMVNDTFEEKQGLEKLFEEWDKFEDCAMESEKASGDLVEEKLPMVKNGGNGSNGEYVVKGLSENDKMSENSGSSSSWRSNSSSVLSSHGSMREEKEYRKTLACKLFEERHNSLGGEEGMDSLWESYEDGNLNKRNEKTITKDKSKEMVKKNSYNCGSKSFYFHDNEDQDEDEEEDEEIEMSNGHLCCLQAFKLSTGKLNLGMKKTNIMKISKALKGFGWLHRVKNKHGKKS